MVLVQINTVDKISERLFSANPPHFLLKLNKMKTKYPSVPYAGQRNVTQRMVLLIYYKFKGPGLPHYLISIDACMLSLFQKFSRKPKCSVRGSSVHSRVELLNVRPKYFPRDALLTFLKSVLCQKVSSSSPLLLSTWSAEPKLSALKRCSHQPQGHGTFPGLLKLTSEIICTLTMHTCLLY